MEWRPTYVAMPAANPARVGKLTFLAYHPKSTFSIPLRIKTRKNTVSHRELVVLGVVNNKIIVDLRDDSSRDEKIIRT